MTVYRPFDQEEKLGPPPWPYSEALTAWETAHGHDVRLKCYVEFGCMVIEPWLESIIDKLNREVNQLRAENDRLRMDVINAKAAADVFERTMKAAGDYGRCLQSEDATLKAELAEARAEVDRLRASQLPDDGTWETEYGPPHAELGFKRRMWLGKVEPIGDDQDGVRYGQHQPGTEGTP
jgi:hypothetical protein